MSRREKPAVPQDVYKRQTEVNPSTAVGMLVAVFDIVKSNERIKAQQDGMAHEMCIRDRSCTTLRA